MAVEGTAIEYWSQPNAEMLAGNGYADSEANVVCGFVIPSTWETFDVSILWGIWSNPGTLADLSFALLGDFGSPGLTLPNPSFVDAVTVAQEDITIGVMNETVLAAGVEVEAGASLYSVHVNRTMMLVGVNTTAKRPPVAALIVDPSASAYGCNAASSDPPSMLPAES